MENFVSFELLVNILILGGVFYGFTFYGRNLVIESEDRERLTKKQKLQLSLMNLMGVLGPSILAITLNTKIQKVGAVMLLLCVLFALEKINDCWLEVVVSKETSEI